MGEFFSKVWELLTFLVVHFNKPSEWKEKFEHPEVFWPALAVLAFVIFAETGLMVGFFLPGDSLLVMVGVFANTVGWNIWAIAGVLMAAAVLGNCTGYAIGAKAGPRLFNRPKSLWFKRDHLLAAKAFFDKQGGITVALAQFMPFARTFVPAVAGAAHMRFRTFFVFNVGGAVAWIGSMLLFGYYAVDWLNGGLRKFLGDDFDIKKHVDVLAIAVVVLSVMPMIIHAGYKWLARRKQKKAAQADVAAADPIPSVEAAAVPSDGPAA